MTPTPLPEQGVNPIKSEDVNQNTSSLNKLDQDVKLKSKDELTKTPKSSLGVSNIIIPRVYDWCIEIGIVLSNEQAIKLSAIITADRERVALEARIDERQMLSFHRAYGRDYQATLETLEETNDERIAELKAQLKDVDDTNVGKSEL